MPATDYIGQELRDIVTGFAGRCIGYAHYETGADQCLIQPKLKDGEWRNGQWFDLARIEIMKVDV